MFYTTTGASWCQSRIGVRVAIAMEIQPRGEERAATHCAQDITLGYSLLPQLTFAMSITKHDSLRIIRWVTHCQGLRIAESRALNEHWPVRRVYRPGGRNLY